MMMPGNAEADVSASDVLGQRTQIPSGAEVGTPSGARADPIRHEASFEATHRAASDARRGARRCMDVAGVPGPIAADVELIVAELTSNAVEQRPEADIHLELLVGDDVVRIVVTNETDGDRAAPFPIPTPTGSVGGAEAFGLAERGWGLSIVERLSDELTVDQDRGRTSVRAVRSLRPPGDVSG